MPRLKKKKTLIYIVSFGLIGCILYGFKSSSNKIQTCSSSSKIPRLIDPRQSYQNQTCENDNFCIIREPAVDIQMLDVYSKISFKHDHGGDWEEGWCVQHDPSVWTQSKKLKVIVVPHSHNDPGWLMTYDEYYITSTKHILDGVLRNLNQHPDMTFVWAEISYFSRWFEDLLESQKVDVVEKQLEIVSGGWVMPDEANSHWYSLIMQLSEGQQWVKTNLNATLVTAWSIDPFGHSPTMAYVLQKSGFKQMVIGRTHHIVKKHFAMYKDLEFQWKQNWDSSGKDGIFTHMLPFNSYAIKYSHGPYRSTAGLFDFRKNSKWYWPWEDRPEEITLMNVKQRADLLVQQWQKKATLYQTPAILVPHGDDFRYRTQEEWDDQRSNLVKLFSFINDLPSYNIEVKFGTLSDYFEEVQGTYPSLSGDFFTYSDEKEDYWSGYFTTRPYHKRMDRILLHLIRSAEIINVAEHGNEITLEAARRAHSLYQHHDGITGTARERVVADYAAMNREAVKRLHRVIQPSIYSHIITDDTSSLKSGDQTINIFNSLPQHRKESVEVFSFTYTVMVKDGSGNKIPFQIAPVLEWTKSWTGIYIPRVKTPALYRIIFTAEVPALSFIEYKVEEIGKLDENAFLTKFTIFHDQAYLKYPFDDPFKSSFHFASSEEFRIWNYTFNEKGFLQGIIMKNEEIKIELSFLKYMTHRWWSDKSGAYLFLPRGQAQRIYTKRRAVIISEGPIESRVTTGFEFGIHENIMKDGSFEIFNRINICNRNNQEIVMRIDTATSSNDTFFTDLNAFQVIKRNRLKKLPLQANYYPIPSAIYIQDEYRRLTLLSGQPLGGSSLKSGQMEIMQDRRLRESDGRGLGEGVMDNQMTQNSFRLILENAPKSFIHVNHPAGFHTKRTNRELLSLLNPVIKISTLGPVKMPRMNFGHLSEGFEVVSLRRMIDGSVGVVIHRTYLEEEDPDLEYQVDLKYFVKGLKLYRSNILLTEQYEEVTSTEILFKPMETKGFIVL